MYTCHFCGWKGTETQEAWNGGPGCPECGEVVGEPVARRFNVWKDSNAQECLERLRVELLGPDWYIVDSVGGNQGNEILTDEIIRLCKPPKTFLGKLLWLFK